MDRDKFCCLHWSYYLVLEKDFLDVERYISFDFGDNYLYDSDHTVADYANSTTFSNEFVKQYQAICSEVDVILKTICREYFCRQYAGLYQFSVKSMEQSS